MPKRSLKKDILLIILTIIFTTVFSYLLLPYLPISALQCVTDGCIIGMTLILSLISIVITFLVAYLLFINKERKDIKAIKKFLIISIIAIIIIYILIGFLLKGTFLEFVEEEEVVLSDLEKAKISCVDYCNTSDIEHYCNEVFEVDITGDRVISYPGEYLKCWKKPIDVVCEDINCNY